MSSPLPATQENDLRIVILGPQVAPGSIATLGPQGTSSEEAARHLSLSIASDSRPLIQLLPSYEDARDAVLRGNAKRLLVANAYQGIDDFYMDPRLSLEQAFVYDTPGYGIAAQPATPLPVRCRVVTHPAPRALVPELIPPGYQVDCIEFAPSTSSAAEGVAMGRYNLALTTVPAAKLHQLTFISATRPIRMLWSVFTLGNQNEERTRKPA